MTIVPLIKALKFFQRRNNVARQDYDNNRWESHSRQPEFFECRSPWSSFDVQDFQLLENLAHQKRERIPERTVHAKGSGAYGKLTILNDISQYTKAKVLQKGTVTDLFMRLSTVAGERGAADAERDVRGFAIKFYTDEGNWDLVGNNAPVFFIRDPLKFPDFIHTQKRHPRTNLRSNAAMWDFWSLSPESIHQVTILMSDRGLPKGFRHMHGFGSHTYSLINAKNERFWVKFHFISEQGIEDYTNDEAAAVVAKTRESSQEDLFNAIERKEFPRWKLKIQIMTQEQADKYIFNPFDLTKVWTHKEYPLIDVGVLELNRNPQNYFAEVEQASFSPSNIVSGISFSPDKMLQARIFAYTDAHRYRVGTHFEMLSINRPKVPINTYHADGPMRFDIPEFGDAYYEPNSFGGPKENKAFLEPPFPADGDGDRYNHRVDDDYFSQPRALFNLMKPEQKNQLFGNIATAMKDVPREIIDRQVALFDKVDPAYGAGVRKALGL